jgi:cytochrome c556
MSTEIRLPRTRTRLTLCAVAALALPVGALVAAETATPLAQQKARHDHYHELGDAFKVVRDQTKATAPDTAALQKAAQVVNDASIDQGRWFPKGTGTEAGKTRALPEIWSKPADFVAAQKLFSDAAPQLLAAAKANDIDGVKNAIPNVGKACKNCHDNFRSPEEHD